MAKTDKNLQKLAKTDHNSGTIEIWVMYVSTDCGNSKSTATTIMSKHIWKSEQESLHFNSLISTKTKSVK